LARVTRRRRVQVCGSSALGKQCEVLADLRAAGCVIEIERCLDRCTGCEVRAFGLVSGRFVFASSPEEFRRKVLR